jgi:hypothetical protein
MISELMIPIISQHDVFVDIDIGPLVNGKVEILDPVSNNLLNVYSYTDDEYVIAANPVILDIEGRPEQTIFSDRLSYLRVYAYDGLDEHNQPMYHFVRDFYAGHNAQSEVTSNVIGMEALKDADPAYNTQVTVVGYHNQFDCEPRTYIWDPNSTLDADNGYVVASDVSDTGRWILQFDGPYIPSNYYGVYPGHVANINALATFIGEIHGKATAPGIYMIPGNYGDTRLITTKKVLLFSNTQISSIECSWIDVKGKPTTWIGNIFPSDSNCPVHSSWYKHARSFWGAGSKHKYCDGKNWIDNAIVANMGQNNVTFYTDGSPALVTDTGDYRLSFTGCKLVGPTGFLHKDSKCHFQSMEFTDKYFVSIDTNNITFNTTLAGFKVTMDADNFKNVENMIKLYSKAGYDTIDCKNYSCGATADADLSEYLVIEHLNANYAKVGKANGLAVTLKNSKVNYLTIANAALSVVHSDVRITTWPNNFASLNVSEHSTITGGWYLTKGAVNCVDSNWFMQINQATDNTTDSPALNFLRSNINATINTKNFAAVDCKINNSNISIYPYFANNKYWLRLALEGCNIDQTEPIKFTLVANDYNCKHCYWDNVRVVDNDFQGNTKGIACPYWANKSYRTIFIARDNDNGNSGYYVRGNTGNCPGGGDAKWMLHTSNHYNFNTNLDPYVTKSYYLDVQGTYVRMWLPYQADYGFAQTERYCTSNAMKLHCTVISPKDGQDDADESNVYQYNEQPVYSWRDTWISNASFCLNNLDPNYTGTRDMDELDDWFAARIVRPTSTGTTKNNLYIIN